MILPEIDQDLFLSLVRSAPVIAFQRVRYGYAVAAEGEAYYAPLMHPGGGNLSPDVFTDRLGYSFLERMSQPQLKTLRPMAEPFFSPKFVDHLTSRYGSPDPEEGFARVPGDHPLVIEHQTQVVITAIAESGRPDLKDAVSPLKREALVEAVTLVVAFAEKALADLELETAMPMAKLHLMQASTAMRTALSLLLQ